MQYFLISWKFARITASLSLHVGRCLDDESVKEWDFGASWYWCKMKIIMMLSHSVKTKCLKIFESSGNLRKQTKTTWKYAFFCIWGNLHHLRWSVSFSEVNFIIRFSGNEFSQDCSVHHSFKCHVLEKLYL